VQAAVEGLLPARDERHMAEAVIDVIELVHLMRPWAERPGNPDAGRLKHARLGAVSRKVQALTAAMDKLDYMDMFLVSLLMGKPRGYKPQEVDACKPWHDVKQVLADFSEAVEEARQRPHGRPPNSLLRLTMYCVAAIWRLHAATPFNRTAKGGRRPLDFALQVCRMVNAEFTLAEIRHAMRTEIDRHKRERGEYS
jgi:hypothetical protein